ncbi:MAG: universal stress protein [Nocardioidaceae bacterium]|nr:universal stress protein [Nocardioidaceae bacterium]
MPILTGYVPTPVGEAAFEASIAEAQRRQLPLVVLNATSGAGTDDRYYADDETATRLRSRLEASGLDYQLLRSNSSRDPSEEIIGMAADLHAELIVIGLRPRTPVGKLILGSTAQRVLLDASCPVLAVKSSD